MHRLVTGRLLTLGFLLLCLEGWLASFPGLVRGRVGLLPLLVLDYAFFRSVEKIPFFALLAGLARDFSGGHAFGIETLSFTVIGFLLYLAILKLDHENALIRYGLVSLFVLFSESLSFALGVGVELSGRGSWRFVGLVFWAVLYTTAAAPGFFWLTNRWFRRTAFFRQYELFS